MSARPSTPSADSAFNASLVLGCEKSHVVDHQHPIAAGPVGQGRRQCETHHLLGGALRVAAGLGRMSDAAAHPVRCADRALTRSAGALLAPRLDAAASNLAARLGALRARSTSRELRGDHLVQHGLVRLDCEDFVGYVDRAGVRAADGLDGERRHHRPPFTASRMMTVPPRGPGTAPRTSNSPWSASVRTTWKLSVVTLSPPVRPAMRRPRNTREPAWRTARPNPANDASCGCRVTRPGP